MLEVLDTNTNTNTNTNTTNTLLISRDNVRDNVRIVIGGQDPREMYSCAKRDDIIDITSYSKRSGKWSRK
jgi:hypothetical protein